MTAIDYFKESAACVLLALATLSWVHFSRQTSVSRSIRSSLAIALRIVLVHVIAIPIIRAGTGWSVDFLAIPLVVILALLPVAKLENIAGFDVGGLALAVIFIMPVYVLKQFVLGFPDRKEFVLEPPPSIASISPEVLSSTGTTAIVVAPLRPFGYVQLNGERVAATSVDGRMIDAGVTVDVCGRRNTTWLVKVIDSRTPSN